MAENAAIVPDRPEEEQQLIERTLTLVRELATELHPQMPGIERLGADASIERDFGLDSLARVELGLRIEQTLDTPVSETALAESETVRDLAHALRGARPAAPAGPSRQELPQPVRLAVAPPSPATLLEALDWHASTQPERAHILLIEQDGSSEPVTFGALRTSATEVASGLLRRGIRPGESIAIMLPTGREFFAAFFGALYAQAVPVPLYPPARPGQIETHLRRVAGILANCRARVLLTFEAARRFGHLLRPLDTELAVIATVAELSAPPDTPFRSPAVRPADTAFLQYTSGSTGAPKGVVLTHANLLSNLTAMQQATGVTASDCFVSWLPLYHDMGLIGACFGALAFGFPLVLMSPTAFLAHPINWLRAIDRHRATITAAPNFAYELCLSHVSDDELAELDLSTLRVAFNSAETISARTLELFAERFGRCGLRRSALTPAYGLAECSLGLTMPPVGRGPLVDRIDRASFLRAGVASPAPPGDAAALTVVCCGRPLPGHAVRIVDAAGATAPERMQGRIEFQGPSATSGYFSNAQETARLFDGNWLDTGDLGYLAAGELYVTGRAKDIIIRGGHNIHPNELEEAVGRLPDVRKGGVVAFPATDRRSGTERIVVLVETGTQDPLSRADLMTRVNRLAVDLMGVPIDEVVLVPPRTVLKTTSGKIRRAACREAYEQGRLGASRRAPWVQLLRLRWQGWTAEFGRAIRRLSVRLRGAWAVAVAGLLAPWLWLAVVLAPGLARRRRIGAACVRLVAHLAGIRMPAPQRDAYGTRVYVSNHASYLDALVLIATLPPDVAFVAKQEFRRSVLLGPLFRRLGCLFVERRAVHEALASAAELQASLDAGHSLHVFPEGTFQRAPGLLPFHMGAFRAAAATGAAVVPVALCGTRAMLPDGALLPRPARLEVIMGTPLLAEDRGWYGAVKVRRMCREHILAHIGEPDLEWRASAAPSVAAPSSAPAP